MSSIASTTCNSLGSELFLANNLPISKKRWEKHSQKKLEGISAFFLTLFLQGESWSPTSSLSLILSLHVWIVAVMKYHGW